MIDRHGVKPQPVRKNSNSYSNNHPKYKLRSTSKKLAIAAVAGLLWVSPVLGGTSFLPGGHSSVSAASSPVVKLSEEIITSGAKLVKYQYTTTRSGSTVKVLADVVQIDLSNPYVKLDVMTGKNGQVTTRQSVEGMAKETGAVAGVNGDFFNTGGQGVAIGGSVSNGTMVTSPNQLQGMYSFFVTKDGKPSIERFTFEGSVQAEDGTSIPLAGINKEAYKTEPDNGYSHVNAMYIYTSAWKSESRPKDSSTTPTEILVQNGVVQQIASGSAIPGVVPADGYILRAHGTAATYALTHLTVGSHVTANYQLKTASSGQLVDPANLEMLVGGHTLLVDQGQPSSFTRSTSSISGGSAVARTAIGYSQDGRYVYLITAEKNSTSSGMKLAELQKFMSAIGVWKGMNLDGGGSTTLVTRPLGETEADLTFTTSNGGTVQRQVANGVGVYTTAPQGALKGIAIGGAQTLVIGQETNYSLKGYDTYYNPVDSSSIQANWKSSNSNVVWTGSGFKAVKPGTSLITASSSQASASKSVTVLGADSVNALSLGAQTGALRAGATVTLNPSVTLQDGRTIQIPAGSLNWEFIGLKGSVQNGVLTVSSVNSETKTGYAIARYDGFSALIVFTATGEQSWEDFENVSYPITFTPSPAGVTGKAQVVAESDSHRKVLKLNYDMNGGTGNKFAYAQINGTTGRTIPQGATSMSIDVKGDSSLNWARAEFDMNGKTVYVDLARPIDFTGWKTIDIDLSANGLTTGAKLKRLYVVNLEDGRDERAMTGSVSFDNIRFTAPAGGANGLPSATVQMVVGQRTVTVNGTKKTVEVAPVVRNGVTYVPIRYVLDYYGGQTGWSAGAKRIMALRGNVLLELTVGQKDYVYNGKRKTADVTPLILENRTLVPLRLVSEQLGITVKWEQKTKSITLQS